MIPTAGDVSTVATVTREGALGERSIYRVTLDCGCIFWRYTDGEPPAHESATCYAEHLPTTTHLEPDQPPAAT